MSCPYFSVRDPFRKTSARRRALASSAALAVLALSATRPADAAPSASEIERSERALVREVRLRDVLELALARNPELGEASDQARAAASLAPAASRLPDPELEYQLWAAPLERPYAFDDAEMHMFGLRQTFPALGSLDALSEAASARAQMAHWVEHARELELRARARRALAEYRRSENEHQLLLSHVRVASEILELIRASYEAGRGGQQDVLRAMIEVSRLRDELVMHEQERRSARALLNTLMARPLEAPLGPPASAAPESTRAELERVLDQVKRRSPDRRPEVSAAADAVRASEAELEAARSRARWPDFMLGVQYMYMPPAEEPHHYGVTFSMSLPWLSARYGEEVSAGSASVAAGRHALSSARLRARYELYDAAQRLEAARQSLAIVERELLPQAQSSFESAQAVYAGGKGDAPALLDALRTWLDVQIQRERAQTRLDSALADAELALGVGSDVRRTKPIRPEND